MHMGRKERDRIQVNKNTDRTQVTSKGDLNTHLGLHTWAIFFL